MINNTNSSNNNLPLQISIESEMETSYRDYAMSVIVSRALPDCRDGLKPVHRRILYAMYKTGKHHDKPHKKSAHVVGEVMSEHHPHGNAPIYGAMVRMAQNWSLLHPLIDGQGNFGSVDGDPPAAERYTEARLSHISKLMLDDIWNKAVDFTGTYDNSTVEPIVLPAKFPNLLVNGASGIAVGMATNIATHNLGEVMNACKAILHNPDITMEEIIKIIPAPDFPTGALILDADKAKQSLMTGRGQVMMRAKAHEETIANRTAIVVTELPYQVNKAELLKKIHSLSKAKVVEGIHELRDESNKLGNRIVIELKKDAEYSVVLNHLYQHTPLQCSFATNMLALNQGRPELMNIKEMLVAFVNFRKEVVQRRIRHLLKITREKAHVIIGLHLAISNIDEVIALIKSASDSNEAREELINRKWNASSVIPLMQLVDDYRIAITDDEKCSFTVDQAKAILEMKLQKLTNLESSKISDELNLLSTEIAQYVELLASEDKLRNLIDGEMQEVIDNFAIARKTEITKLHSSKFVMEDLVSDDDMAITVTMHGYINSVLLELYRTQKRGGKGRASMNIKEDDYIIDFITASSHTPLLFFSNLGKVYRLKVFNLPQGSPNTRGRALVNILPLASDEKITNILPLPKDKDTWNEYSIIFSTKHGNVRRNELSLFETIQSNGKNAISFDNDTEDSLLNVSLCHVDNNIMLATKLGRAAVFPVIDLRPMQSRASTGVRGVKLQGSLDAAVSMSILNGTNIDIEMREEFLKIPFEKRVATNNLESIEEVRESDIKNCTLVTQEIYYDLCKKEQFILVVTEHGFGKLSSTYDYRVTKRGASGISNISLQKKHGIIINSFAVNFNDEIIIVTNLGTMIRFKVSDLRVTARNTMGVKILNVRKGEAVISASKVARTTSDISDDDTDHEVQDAS